jgi:hypothetical protein
MPAVWGLFRPNRLRLAATGAVVSGSGFWCRVTDAMAWFARFHTLGAAASLNSRLHVTSRGPGIGTAVGSDSLTSGVQATSDMRSQANVPHG